MGYFQDIFGKQDLGQIIGGALNGILNNRNAGNTGNTTPSTNNNGIDVPVNFGLDNNSITKMGLWVGGIVIGAVLLIFAFRRK